VCFSLLVAPRAGAWIETARTDSLRHDPHVAPRAGAWIETACRLRLDPQAMSRPVRARGLKLAPYELLNGYRSRPVRARGLKPDITLSPEEQLEVAPRAGAWIETRLAQGCSVTLPSRPVRARGLKQRAGCDGARSPGVAPRAGAWIETTMTRSRLNG